MSFNLEIKGKQEATQLRLVPYNSFKLPILHKHMWGLVQIRSNKIIPQEFSIIFEDFNRFNPKLSNEI